MSPLDKPVPDAVLDSIPRHHEKIVQREPGGPLDEFVKEWREQQRREASRTPRSVAEDAFFAGVLHGEKRNGVPIHEAFDAWWPPEPPKSHYLTLDEMRARVEANAKLPDTGPGHESQGPSWCVRR